MESSHYPSLYRAAENASSRAQKHLLIFTILNGCLLILASTFSFLSVNGKWGAIISSILLILSLGVTILIKASGYKSKWYAARALAESIKTSAWRYMMRAEPFVGAGRDQNADKKFTDLLDDLVTANSKIGDELILDSNNGQVTSTMKCNRNLGLSERKALYLDKRINNQLNWYNDKSSNNRTKGKIFFIVIVIVYLSALIFTFLRIAYPTYDYFPVEPLVTTALFLIVWIELKKFDELKAAYNLTSIEVSIIKSKYDEVDDQSFPDFVADSENAFSREHTQWAARRDH